MTTSEKVEKIEFINLDNKVPKWSKLCSDCNEYGYLKKRTKIINEGENNIIVRAINSNDLIKEKTFSIFVDSKTPKIKSIFPTRGFTNGIFNIEFSELNPENLTLYYGNEGHYLEKNVNLSKCYVEDDDKYFCQVNVNLSEFDSEEISYYFKLVDIGDNTKTSKVNDLDVDLTNPVINSLNYDIEGRYVYFTIGVDETYFDEVGYSYIDSKGKVKEKRLCTKLKNDEVCEKKTSFKDGTHNITIYAKDEVGQKDEKDISFLIDSKEPRIKKTIPTRGFTNGIFNIEFVEQNPVDLILYYGYKWNYSEKKVNLSECFIEEDEYFCEVSLNLSEFNSEEINYYFELIDIVERKDITKPRNLDVDTTSPVLNNPDWFWYQGEERNKRYIYFYFDVTEDNFDSIVYTYIDSRGREREKKICSRLKDGICTAKKSFSRGEHILDIKIKDKAGNSVSTESVEFVV